MSHTAHARVTGAPGAEGVEHVPEQEENGKPVARMIVYEPVIN